MRLRFLFVFFLINVCWNCYTIIGSTSDYEREQPYKFTPSEIKITLDSAWYAHDTLIHKEYPPDVGNKIIFYTKEPSVIRRVEPECLTTSVNDSVNEATHLKVLVDRGGIVRKAIILNSTNPIYNECSLKAAMQWKFTPAMTKQGAVSCWVVFSFKF